MKIIAKTLFILSFILLIAGCRKDNYNPNQVFTLKYEQKAYLNLDGKKTEIRFTKLKEDSRCEPGSYCNAIGEVAVEIKLNGDKFKLGHHHDYPASIVYKNHLIQLLDVYYSKSKHFGKEKHCIIKLRID